MKRRRHRGSPEQSAVDAAIEGLAEGGSPAPARARRGLGEPGFPGAFAMLTIASGGAMDPAARKVLAAEGA